MKYLGIDFGLRRIGLATSEGDIATPDQIIQVKGFKDAVEKIVGFIKDGNFDKVIIGYPEGKMGKTVMGFVNALKKREIDIEITDETLSSQKAVEQMIKLDVPQKKRRFSDSVAASIILQDYLDTLR
jgi:putative Holliday junction resolvase